MASPCSGGIRLAQNGAQNNTRTEGDEPLC
jgi:hypothetical protein